MMSRFCWYSVYTYDPRSCHGFVLIEHIYVVHDPIWINVYQLVSVVVPSDQYVCDLVSIIEPFKSVDMSLFCCLMLINIYESHSCYSPWLSWPMLFCWIYLFIISIGVRTITPLDWHASMLLLMSSLGQHILMTSSKSVISAPYMFRLILLVN